MAASWKKVIVSGSNAELNQITASGGINAILPSSGQPNFVTYNTGTGQLSYTNTGSFTASTASFVTASNVYGPYGASSVLSSSYAVSSSYSNVAGQTVASLSQGTGISSFSFNGASSATVAVSGASSLGTNAITKWTGQAFGNSSLTDDGTFITGTTSLQLTGAATSLTGSFSGSHYGPLTGTASYALQALSASFAASTNNIAGAINNNVNNYILTAQGTGAVNGESNLTFDGTLLTVTGNATITGDLTVAGTASFTNTDNLNIRDKFILINSGSITLSDSGWVTQYNAAGSGSAFYLEASSAGTYGRFAVAYDVNGAAAAVSPDEFVVTAKINQASNPSAAPVWGSSGNGSGNMWITNASDIYIWA
jgi:hypothetical protein